MVLWLDDIRPPWKYGYIGAEWCKTAEAAIELLKTGRVTFASLDHDLTEAATMGQPAPGEKTGMTVLKWMIENNMWPSAGVHVHSLNETEGPRMKQLLREHGKLAY